LRGHPFIAPPSDPILVDGPCRPVQSTRSRHLYCLHQITQARRRDAMFAQMEAVRLEALHLAHDPATGMRAVIAIHNTRLGPALGGCRFLAYADEESAIRDAMRLAEG